MARKCQQPTPVVAATAATTSATPAAAAAVTARRWRFVAKAVKGPTQAPAQAATEAASAEYAMRTRMATTTVTMTTLTATIEAPTKAAEKRKHRREQTNATAAATFAAKCGGDEARAAALRAGERRRVAVGDDERVPTVVCSIDQRHSCDGQSRHCRRGCSRRRSDSMPLRFDRRCSRRRLRPPLRGAQRGLCDAGATRSVDVYDADDIAQHSVGAGDSRFTADGDERVGACGVGGGTYG
jgi:hypothetical protein